MLPEQDWPPHPAPLGTGQGVGMCQLSAWHRSRGTHRTKLRSLPLVQQRCFGTWLCVLRLA